VKGEWHSLKAHQKGGRFPTFSGSMKRFCGGNLQTAGKPSFFPLVLLRHAAEHVGTKDLLLVRKSFWSRDTRLK
jgi:hypothetical protein